MILDFAVWAPDRQTFDQSWINAGIFERDDQGNIRFTPEYPGISISAQDEEGWAPTRPTGQIIDDGTGNMIAEVEVVPGWHANVRVSGAVADAMTQGLNQYDADGNLKNIFERTHAVDVFGLTEQPLDPATNFPAGYRNSTGVTYADLVDLKSPTNCWA